MSTRYGGNSYLCATYVCASILLQLTSYYEDAVAVPVPCEFLNAPDALEPLCRPALGENDIDFKAISDLISARERREEIERIRTRGAVEERCESTHLDVAFCRTSKGIDDDSEDV